MYVNYEPAELLVVQNALMWTIDSLQSPETNDTPMLQTLHAAYERTSQAIDNMSLSEDELTQIQNHLGGLDNAE